MSPVQYTQQHIDSIRPDQANTTKLKCQQPRRRYCHSCQQNHQLTKPINTAYDIIRGL